VRDSLIVVATKLPSLFGVEPRPFPSFPVYRKTFETAHAQSLRTTEAWVDRHGISAPAKKLELDPGLYSGKHALVLAPHPDDEIIGCGGTILRLIAAGAKVSVVYAADGAASAAMDDLPPHRHHAIRLEHAAAVARETGFDSVHYWKDQGPALTRKDEYIADLETILRNTQPALIFIPFLKDSHPDHVVLNDILAAALRRLSGTDMPDASLVLGYEVWGSAPANIYCDVTSVMPAKEELLLKYTTEMRIGDYVHLCESRQFYNSHLLANRDGYVEGYYSVSCREYPDLLIRS
jgi:LmbE family N-acetylglucosaminyl deacetylase